MRIFKRLKIFLLAAFFFVGGMGYSYFGPSEYTSFVTSRSFFRMYWIPTLDRLLSASGDHSVTVGLLDEGAGELSYRPSSELVFLPARVGQRLYGGTLVSSGEGSRAVITLNDTSKLVLEDNSTVLLESSDEGVEAGSITLKVIKGSVSAEQTEKSTANVKIVTPKGVSKTLSSKKVVVVSTQRSIDPRSISPVHRLAAIEEQPKEFVGLAEESPSIKEIERKLIKNEPIPVIEVSATAPVARANDSDLEKDKEKEKAIEPVIAPPTIEALPAPPLPPEVVVELPAPSAAAVAVVTPLPSSVPASSASVTLIPNSAPAPASIAPAVPAPAVSATNAKNLPPVKIDIKNHTPKTQTAATVPPPPLPLRKVGSRRAKAVAKFAAGPDGNDLTNAIYAQRAGDLETAQRLMARALTRPEYASNGFNDGTRLALESLLDSYIEAGDCSQASNIVESVTRSFGSDPSARAWSSTWRSKVSQATCR